MRLARCGVFRFTIKNKYNNSTLKLHKVDSFFNVVGGEERSRGDLYLLSIVCQYIYLLLLLLLLLYYYIFLRHVVFATFSLPIL